MGYFTIGLILAVVFCTVLLGLPFGRRFRDSLADIFEDTIMGECFDSINNDNGADTLAESIFGAVLGYLLYAFLVVAVWVGILILWPLLAPLFIIAIFTYKNWHRNQANKP